MQIYLLCIFKIDGDIKRLNSFVEIYLTGIWKNFLTSPSTLKVKKIDRPNFGNPEAR